MEIQHSKVSAYNESSVYPCQSLAGNWLHKDPNHAGSFLLHGWNSYYRTPSVMPTTE